MEKLIIGSTMSSEKYTYNHKEDAQVYCIKNKSVKTYSFEGYIKILFSVNTNKHFQHEIMLCYTKMDPLL